MPSYIHHGSTLALFADDSKLFHTIDSVSSSASLQADLDSLHDWSIDHGMAFNYKKCKVLHMSKRKSRRGPLHSYKLDAKELTSVLETSDLGLSVTNQLSWVSHIEEMCAKGNRVLGLVKRVCGRDLCDVQTRQLLYSALVRPVLEYASCVWSPYTIKHRALIENIQRRATKFILNYPPREISYRDRLVQLKLLPLEFRRDINDLVLLFKHRLGLVNTNFNDFFSPVCSSYNTRNSDPGNLRLLSSHRQNYYTKSYFPRTIRLWNSLPHHIKHSPSVSAFKSQLSVLYLDKLNTYQPP
ncbi:uncharacterized protein LOC110252470 [Exaiptasia diaphana]|uniref:Reverse transcriptase domain-containing protein n=1 Tax=Exaiptasia diaphana TaxID=2652724 RepID=A0A913Y4F5_EXADI|nr:uncharacterized protein LOC110252470 [Exaiptasia diaphana]